MALTDATRAAIAFKRSAGLVNASTPRPFFSEVVASQFFISAQEIIGEAINPSPSSASNVQKVTCELQGVDDGTAPGAASSGFQAGRGYNIALQQGEIINFSDGSVTVDDGNSGNSIENRLLRNFRISTGGFRSAPVVDRKINNTLSTLASPGYGYSLFDVLVSNDPNNSGSVPIFPTDERLWQVDPIAGTLVSSGNEPPLDLGPDCAIILYVYTGPTLDEVISGGVGGGGAVNVAAGKGLDEASVNPSTGEVTLAVDLNEVVTNLFPDPINGINFAYNPLSREATFSLNQAFLDDNYIRDDGDSAAGTYNFNAGQIVLNAPGGQLGATNANTIEMGAANITLNAAGTMALDGNLDVLDPNSTGLGEITCVELTEQSSERYKTDIRDLEPLDGRVMALRPVRYNGPRRDGALGLIAEEVAEVMPEVVSFRDGRPEGVNYGRLSAALLQQVQRLSRQNEELTRRVNSLSRG